MRVHINGETRETCAATIAELLGEVGVDPARVAVEVDREIVIREAFETTPLREAANIELVRFVSGG